VQQESWVLDAERGEDHDVRLLALRATFALIHHAGDAAVGVAFDLRRPRLGPDLRARQDGLRHLGQVERRLRPALASPLAVAVVHAGRAALVLARQDRQRGGDPLDPQARHALGDQLVPGGGSVCRLRVAGPFRSPGHGLRTGERHLTFHGVVVRLELLVRDRPVDGDAVPGSSLEVLRPHAQRHAPEMQRPSADAPPIPSVAELELLIAVEPPAIVPVELAEHLQLVLSDVGVGVEPAARLQDHDLPAGFGQTSRQRRSTGAAAHDADIHRPLVTTHLVGPDGHFQRLHRVRYPRRRSALASTSNRSSQMCPGL
jgi:hypothetical protein